MLFLGLLVGAAWMMWRSSRRLARSHPGLEYYPRAIELSIIGFLVAGLTQPRATFDLIYLVAMYAAAWHSVEKHLPSPTPALPHSPKDSSPTPSTPPPLEQAYAGTTRLLGRRAQRSR